MGCSGGTVLFDYYKNIYAFRIIDGDGEPRDIDVTDEDFKKMVINMGLFGIVTKYTFQCVPNYYITGSQIQLYSEEWKKTGDFKTWDPVGKVDFFAKDNSQADSIYNLVMGKDKRSVVNAQYMRYFWWPQGPKDIFVMWKGHRSHINQYWKNKVEIEDEEKDLDKNDINGKSPKDIKLNMNSNDKRVDSRSPSGSDDDIELKLANDASGRTGSGAGGVNGAVAGGGGDDGDYSSVNNNNPDFRIYPYYELGNSNFQGYIQQFFLACMYHVFGSFYDPKTQGVSNCCEYFCGCFKCCPDSCCSCCKCCNCCCCSDDFNCLVCVIKVLIDCVNSPQACGKCQCNVIKYRDIWYKTLPMDQNMNDKLMPCQFTELWFDVKDTALVMNTLKEYFKGDKNLNRMGTFGWECYFAKTNDLWMSPGYKWKIVNKDKDEPFEIEQEAIFRVDVLWYELKMHSPYAFYQNLWDHLVEKGIDFRPHWAKWFAAGQVEFPELAKRHAKYKGIRTWSEFYKMQYPKWDEFLQLRHKYDRRGVFVSSFWDNTFGISVKRYDNDEQDEKDEQDNQSFED